MPLLEKRIPHDGDDKDKVVHHHPSSGLIGPFPPSTPLLKENPIISIASISEDPFGIKEWTTTVGILASQPAAAAAAARNRKK